MVTKPEQDAVVKVLNEKTNRQLMYYLDICTRCAICKDACHQYVTTGDILYMPAYRAQLIRRVFRKYFTVQGKLIPSVVEASAPTDKLLDDLYKTTYACTACRRCMYVCPFSIDTTWFTSVAKAMLVAIGRGSCILGELADAAIMKGDNIEMFRDILIEGLKDTENDLKARVGDPNATIPIGKKGAKSLYVALAGTHTILPMAIIFHEAKADWTLSLFEAANYGYFLGDTAKAKKIAQRFVDEAKALGVEEVILSECGHAYRVMEFFYEAWAKEKLPFKIRAVVDVMHDYVKEGKVKLKPGSLKERVTYHDPCQVGRNGGFYEEPRNLVKAVAADYREMTPNREKQWCCGGGGGLVAEEEFDKLRQVSGQKKVEQIRNTGARVLVTPCENCRLQIDMLNEKNNLGIRISSVMDMVVAAMDLPGAKPA
jgi:Fe-S oxidoreductase